MMNIFYIFPIGLLIGQGPSTPGLLTRVIMAGLGIGFAIAAVAPGTRVRGAFSRGKGRSVPVNTIGRILLCLVAIVTFFLASGILH